MSFCLDFLRNWDLYGISIWESMSSSRQKKLMKLAGLKVSTQSEKNCKKIRKFEKFRKVLEMFRKYFRRVSIVFLGVFRSILEANVLRLEPLRGNQVDSSPRILNFCDTESLYKILKYYQFLLRFSEKLGFIWNFNTASAVTASRSSALSETTPSG